MEQREVTDQQNTAWTCVQAYAGVRGAGDKAEEIASNPGKVPVVCTPAGGARSVRIELDKDWYESMNDEELLRKIAQAHQ